MLSWGYFYVSVRKVITTRLQSVITFLCIIWAQVFMQLSSHRMFVYVCLQEVCWPDLHGLSCTWWGCSEVLGLHNGGRSCHPGQWLSLPSRRASPRQADWVHAGVGCQAQGEVDWVWTMYCLLGCITVAVMCLSTALVSRNLRSTSLTCCFAHRISCWQQMLLNCWG